MTGTTKLTSTSQSTHKTCLRKFFCRYEIGLSRIRQAQPLRFGSCVHAGHEAHNKGADPDTAIASATASYAACPEWADPIDWSVERETVKALLAGHFWRYSQDNIKFLAVEQAFELPLVNPATGAFSRRFKIAGKMDGIIACLADGHLLVHEYKTSGEDIAQGSDYWRRSHCDGQISQYILAARSLGYNVSAVLYDVTRKPTIRLRQSESPEEYGQRLLKDIGDRPDYYYQRREIPRLEEELIKFQAELWQLSQHLLEIRRRATSLADPSVAWFRNVSRLTCGNCEYADLCLQGAGIDPANPPAGFQVLTDPHPELTPEGH